MAGYEEGNLAFKLPMRTVSLPVPKRDFEAERKRKDAARKELIKRQRTRQQYRVLSSLRVKRALAASAVVIFSALLLAFPVWRNAMIMEANYGNVRIQNEISELRREINIREGQMLEITDLMSIRDRAFRTLGMQSHTADQVYHMQTSGGAAQAIEMVDRALLEPVSTIEQYVLSHR